MYFAYVTCTRNRYIGPIYISAWLAIYETDISNAKLYLPILVTFRVQFSRHEFHFPSKHSDPNPMHENKLKKCFFCITLKCSVNPRRAKEKYQIVKKKYILKMGQLKNKAFRNNRNVKDSKILQFQQQMDKIVILIS